MKTTPYLPYLFFLFWLPFTLFGEVDSLFLDNLTNLARQQARTHQYKLAIETNFKLIPLLEKFYNETEHTEIASTYSRIGNCQIDLGQYTLAGESHLKALTMRQKLFGEDSYPVGTSYNNLSITYRKRGLYKDALKLQLLAMENRILTKGKDHVKTARCYENVAINYEYLRDFGLSIRYYEKALAILKKELKPNDLEISELYNNMAGCWRKMQQYERAMEDWKYAKKILLQHPKVDPVKLGRLSANIGYCYFNLECYDDAIQHLNKALHLYDKRLPENHLLIGHIVENLSYVYTKTENWSKAQSYAQQALKIHKYSDNYNVIEIASAYENLAVIAMAEEEMEQALMYLDSAQSVICPTVRTSGIERKKHWNSFLEINLQGDFADIYLQQYNFHKRPEDLKRSLNFTLRSVGMINQQRLSNGTQLAKIHLNAHVLPIYERGIEAAYLLQKKHSQRNYLEIALVLMEKSKSIVLHEALQSTRVALSEQLPDSLEQAENELQRKIAQLDKERYLLKSEYNTDSLTIYEVEQQLFDAQLELDKLLLNLKEIYPKYFQIKYDTTTTKIAEVQRGLAHDQTLVEYFLGQKHTYALVINKDKVDLIRWENGQSLVALSADFQRNVYFYNPFTDSDDSYAQNAFALYRRLVEPIEKLLSKRVVIIPDKEMGYIPFATLISSLPTNFMAFQNYQYLLKKYQFSYVHSATLWTDCLQQKRTINSKNLLAVAPSFANDQPIALRSSNGNQQRDLKYNVEESRVIAEHWNGDLLTGREATKEEFLMQAPNYRLLHLATHGQVDDNEGDFANLAFSGIAPDNLLYLREIYNMKLNAEMLVLSACETGTGPLRKGDGIISLARGFTYAGVQSIITTLWKINDRTSVYLMNEFYQQLLDKKTKDVALQQAQLKYLSEQPAHLAHPFYWAAFIPIGNMGIVQPVTIQPSIFVIFSGSILLILVGGVIFWRKKRTKTIL